MPGSRFTAEEVRMIRRLRGHNLSYKKIAEIFGTSGRNIYCIARKQTYRWVREKRPELAWLDEKWTRHIYVGFFCSCWPWLGAKNNCGYGRSYTNGHSSLVHRRVWEAMYGPVPQGLCVCHHCDNPACCNPQHLFVGSQRDNLYDRDRKGRSRRDRLGRYRRRF